MSVVWQCAECGSDKKHSYATLCRKCQQRKRLREDPEKHNKKSKEYYAKNKEKILAKSKEWNIKNKEHLKQYRRNKWLNRSEEKKQIDKEIRIRRAENNIDKSRLSHKKCRDKVRLEVISNLGGKCQCCGEVQFEFLTIDHINGGGREHRKRVGSAIYFAVRKEKYPKNKYRVLCYNCNCAIGAYGKCPHKQKKR